MTDPLEKSRYQLIRRLAVGGMGEVLLARTGGEERYGLGPGLVVIKRTIPKHPSLEHQNRMLKEEGRIALRLRHANLVETFALDAVDDTPLLVMEYLAGRSMAQVLGAAKRTGEMVAVEVALKVIHEAACGLHFAHTLRDGDRLAGLVHRDVSPANIFVTFDGRVKVIDFGVAKADDSEIKTSTGVLKGKIGYMSPEHTLGEKLDPRSDLWSLGVLLWETLVADRLFAHQNPALTLHKINNGEIQRPRALRADVPASVDDLVMRLLTRPKEDRVASGAELVRLIDAIPDVAWRSVDLGAFLSGRFPDEAERGQAEAREAARARGEPVPQGLVTGSTGSDTDLDAATVVANRRDLLELAKAAGSAPRGGAAIPAAPDDEDDEAARTIQLSAAEVAELTGLAPPSAVPRPGEAARTLPFTPRAVPVDDVVATLAAPLPAELLGTLSDQRPVAAFHDDSAIPTQSDSGRPVDPSADTARERAWRPGEHPPISGEASSDADAATMPATLAETPRSREASGPTRRTASDAGAGSKEPSGSQRTSSKSQLRRPAGPSAASVALGTFGLLACVMGVAFTMLQPGADPTLHAWPAQDGTDVVSARIDVPEGISRRTINLATPQLVVAAGKGAVPVAREDLLEKLGAAGVMARASLPHTPRGQLAAALPPLFLVLGFLALAWAIPAFLLRGAAALVARLLLLVASGAFAAFALFQGLFGWPGLDALRAPAAVLPAPTVKVVDTQDRGGQSP